VQTVQWSKIYLKISVKLQYIFEYFLERFFDEVFNKHTNYIVILAVRESYDSMISMIQKCINISIEIISMK